MTIRKHSHTVERLDTTSTVGGGGDVYCRDQLIQTQLIILDISESKQTNESPYMNASHLNIIPLGDYITSS